MRLTARHIALPAAAAFLLSGCSAAATSTQTPTQTAATSTSAQTAATTTPAQTRSSTTAMQHPMDGGPAPAGITAATDAKYPIGTKVTLTADHMPGMNGAPATVVGVYLTITYAVTYTPTTGGPAVVDHKWVVQEELKDAGTKRLANGTAVTIEADHMPGMNGAKGVVVSSTTEPVYIVDYTAGGMTMKNHKWVVESEIKPAG